MSTNKTQCVVVGLSGGVDSSVTAALMQQEGYEVIGVHLQMAHEVPGSVASGCTASADRQDAIRVAAQLGIRVEVVEAADVYDERVLQPFLQAYQEGRTPNPDVWCNEFVKFPLLLAAADRLGADWVATGHYARTTDDGHLLRGVDAQKDQSYFLCRLTRKQLHRIRFPLGEYTKTDVRALAESFGLSTATKRDSVGLCFVGDINVAQFLRERLPRMPGSLVTPYGERVGEHDGLPFYTIGQRKGIELPGGPWYVVEKRLASNELVVSNVQGDERLYRSHASVRALRWFDDDVSLGDVASLTAQLRYRQEPQRVRIQENDLLFSVPQRAVTPGQMAVVYAGDRVMAAGEIV